MRAAIPGGPTTPPTGGSGTRGSRRCGRCFGERDNGGYGGNGTTSTRGNGGTETNEVVAPAPHLGPRCRLSRWGAWATTPFIFVTPFLRVDPVPFPPSPP